MHFVPGTAFVCLSLVCVLTFEHLQRFMLRGVHHSSNTTAATTTTTTTTKTKTTTTTERNRRHGKQQEERRKKKEERRKKKEERRKKKEENKRSKDPPKQQVRGEFVHATLPVQTKRARENGSKKPWGRGCVSVSSNAGRFQQFVRGFQAQLTETDRQAG